jgi:hypothetical protein
MSTGSPPHDSEPFMGYQSKVEHAIKIVAAFARAFEHIARKSFRSLKSLRRFCASETERLNTYAWASSVTRAEPDRWGLCSNVQNICRTRMHCARQGRHRHSPPWTCAAGAKSGGAKAPAAVAASGFPLRSPGVVRARLLSTSIGAT